MLGVIRLVENVSVIVECRFQLGLIGAGVHDHEVVQFCSTAAGEAPQWLRNPGGYVLLKEVHNAPRAHAVTARQPIRGHS
eukprot:EC798995.1.p2 GENE.EC798995.1~~EC798995.1.p2  ORF type:complete len:80 (-),score=4.34 EC798995.1:366-605(-)